jgi:hypothetical protein
MPTRWGGRSASAARPFTARRSARRRRGHARHGGLERQQRSFRAATRLAYRPARLGAADRRIDRLRGGLLRLSAFTGLPSGRTTSYVSVVAGGRVASPSHRQDDGAGEESRPNGDQQKPIHPRYLSEDERDAEGRQCRTDGNEHVRPSAHFAVETCPITPGSTSRHDPSSGSRRTFSNSTSAPSASAGPSRSSPWRRRSGGSSVALSV